MAPPDSDSPNFRQRTQGNAPADGPIIDLKAVPVRHPPGATGEPARKAATPDPKAPPVKAPSATPATVAPSAIKAADPKPLVPKTPDPKTPDLKIADSKAADVKAGDAKAPDFKPVDAKPAAAAARPGEPPRPAAATAGSTARGGPAVPGGPAVAAGKGPEPLAKPSPAASVPPVGTGTSSDADAQRGFGFGTVAAAAVIGGILGAGCLRAADMIWPARAGADPRVAAIEQRIAALPPQDAAQALARRVDAAEARLKTLPDEVKSARDAATAAASRSEETARSLAALTSAPASTTPAQNVDRLARVDQQLSALQADIAARAKTAAEAGQTLDKRVAAIEEAATARGQAVVEAQGALDRQVKDQARGIAELGTQIAGRADGAQLAAGLRIVAADRVMTALATGQPYADALAALRGLKGGDLAPLEPFAAGGAPTAAALAREFRPIGERLTAEERTAAQRAVASTGSIGDRLASMAEAVVTIRRSGEPATAAATGPSPVDRLQAALDRGALREAGTAWDGLSDSARRSTQAFGDTLKRRIGADAAAAALTSAAFAALPATAR